MLFVPTLIATSGLPAIWVHQPAPETLSGAGSQGDYEHEAVPNARFLRGKLVRFQDVEKYFSSEIFFIESAQEQ